MVMESSALSLCPWLIRPPFFLCCAQYLASRLSILSESFSQAIITVRHNFRVTKGYAHLIHILFSACQAIPF